MRWLALLVLVGCHGPFDPEPFWASVTDWTDASRTGLRIAEQCADANGLHPVRPVADLTLYLVPGRTFDLKGHRSVGNDLPWSGYAIGWKVYIAEQRKDLTLLWAHELLHALYGLPGLTPETHSPIFARCGLSAI